MDFLDDLDDHVRKQAEAAKELERSIAEAERQYADGFTAAQPMLAYALGELERHGRKGNVEKTANGTYRWWRLYATVSGGYLNIDVTSTGRKITPESIGVKGKDPARYFKHLPDGRVGVSVWDGDGHITWVPLEDWLRAAVFSAF